MFKFPFQDYRSATNSTRWKIETWMLAGRSGKNETCGWERQWNWNPMEFDDPKIFFYSNSSHFLDHIEWNLLIIVCRLILNWQKQLKYANLDRWLLWEILRLKSFMWSFGLTINYAITKTDLQTLVWFCVPRWNNMKCPFRQTFLKNNISPYVTYKIRITQICLLIVVLWVNWATEH